MLPEPVTPFPLGAFPDPKPAVPPELPPLTGLLAGRIAGQLAPQWRPAWETEDYWAEYRIKQAQWNAQRAEAEARKEQVKPMARVMRDLEPILRERQARELREQEERAEQEFLARYGQRRSHGTPGATGERNSRVIPQDVKIAVALRDQGRCVQCGSAEDLHYDHKIPWSKGGANTVNNIQLLCGTCNRRKGASE